MKDQFHLLRREYLSGENLNEKDGLQDPFTRLKKWLEEAIASGIPDPHAMALATVGETGIPSVRIVLLQETNEKGLVFYTNYNSRKGKEIAQHPEASVLFFWPQLERQIRVEGIVWKTDAETSAAYFKKRPGGSQIAAWVSAQSTELESREMLEEEYRLFGEKFRDREIPCPEFWGGYELRPVSFEFWQGQPDRLHDRLVYRSDESGAEWKISRLAP